MFIQLAYNYIFFSCASFFNTKRRPVKNWFAVSLILQKRIFSLPALRCAVRDGSLELVMTYFSSSRLTAVTSCVQLSLKDKLTRANPMTTSPSKYTNEFFVSQRNFSYKMLLFRRDANVLYKFIILMCLPHAMEYEAL